MGKSSILICDIYNLLYVHNRIKINIHLKTVSMNLFSNQKYSIWLYTHKIIQMICFDARKIPKLFHCILYWKELYIFKSTMYILIPVLKVNNQMKCFGSDFTTGICERMRCSRVLQPSFKRIKSWRRFPTLDGVNLFAMLATSTKI